MAKDKLQKRIRMDQIKLAYENQLLATLASFACAVILIIVEWNSTNKINIISWTLLVFLVYGYRWIMAYFYAKAHPSDEEMEKWGNSLYFGIILIGFVWGISSFLLFSSDSMANQSFHMVIFLGICAGAVTTMSVFFKAAVTFFALLLIPLCIRFSIIDTSFHHAMAVMIGIYLIIMTYMAYIYNKNITEVIKLRITTKAQADEMQKYEKSHEEFIENLPVAVFRCSFGEKDLFAMANASLTSLLGYSKKEEVIQMSFNDLCVSPSEYKLFRVALISQGHLRGEGINLKKKDGSILPVMITASLTRTSEGKLRYFDGIIQGKTSSLA